MRKQIFVSESIEVIEVVGNDGDVQRQLLLGPPFVHPQGAIKPQQPNFHIYQFTQNLTYAALCSTRVPEKALFLGLGVGMAIQTLRRIYPELHSTVVDLNEQLFYVANDFFFSLEAPNINLVHADADQYIRTTPHRFDFIGCDIWSSALSAPDFLTQHETFERFKQLLNPEGVFAINAPSHLHKLMTHSMSKVFKHARSLMANNTFIVGSDAPLHVHCEAQLKQSLLKDNVDVDNITRHSFDFPA